MADAFHFPLGPLPTQDGGGRPVPGQRGTDSVAWGSPSHFMVATFQTWRGREGCFENRFFWGEGESANFYQFSPVYFENLVADFFAKKKQPKKQISFVGYFCLTPAILSRGLGLLKGFLTQNKVVGLG